MPVFLKRDDTNEMLTVEFSGLRDAEFSDALAKVQSVPGRRWNPDTKLNEFPLEADTCLKLMQMLEPIADAGSQLLVKGHAAEVAEQLVTKLPEDAVLETNLVSASEGHELRGYQRAAVAWLQEHPRTILADEMGLGKCVEALATVQEAISRAGPADIEARVGPLAGLDPAQPRLIVCPNAVRGTWVDEIEDWLGLDEPWTVIDGKTPAKRLSQLEQGLEVPGRWVIVNWEKLRLIPQLQKPNWLSAFADEAHRAKNHTAQQSKALHKIHAPIQLALTGTPIMNSPDELYSLLRWLRPEQYTNYWRFFYTYCDQYVAHFGPRKAHVVVGVLNADQLRFELSDKLVRRTKREVLKELPPKTYTHVPVDLDPPTRKLYNEVNEVLFLNIEKFIAEHDDVTMEDIERMPLKTIEGMIPNAGANITRLRQITSAYKVGIAEEIIRDNPGTPFVTFCWYVDSVRTLAERLRKGKPALTVGEIAGTDDADPVKDAFQAGDLDHVVASIAKGGQGLTLTRASNAIAVDEDWVPGINEQAYDRLHRLGQKDPVTIQIIRVRDTVDEQKVAKKLKQKVWITRQVLGEPEEAP